ncbi:MAG: hypothetical protein ABI539_12335 [Acidobacteriota bacterium]
MGNLARFDLARYASVYDLGALVETGTFRGHGVRAALAAGFEQIISIEIVEQYFDENTERFKDFPNVEILEGHSADVLDQVAEGIEGNVLFWLDAHFPGADGGVAGFNAVADESVRCPLEKELEAIRLHRPDRNDVFLIDDLRLYEPGNYEEGNLPEEIRPPNERGIGFASELFGETHHLVRLLYDQGYLLILPKTDLPKIYVRRTLAEAMAHGE